MKIQNNKQIHLPTDADCDSPFFSLGGQRINGQPTQKGVYVRNGKKVVIK